MEKYDFIIIGSGLGGLQTAYILAKEGYNVCVLEKNKQFGGASQSFKRDGVIFDTGVHYVGSFDKGQVLNNYFKYFDLTDKLNVKKLDKDKFDIISFYNDKTEYNYANGYENFKNKILEKFPKEKVVLERYVYDLKGIKKNYPLFNMEIPKRDFAQESVYNNISISSYLNSLTNNKKLINVLAGTNLLYAGEYNRSPLSIHALIINSYIESAYKFIGGSMQMVDLLVAGIKKFGGTVLKNKKVVKFNFNDKKIESVETENGEIYFADNFISNFHPKETLKLLPREKIRKVYYDRISEIKNTLSTFVLYISFKKDRFKNINSNFYHYFYDDVWGASSYKPELWPNTFMASIAQNSLDHNYADGMSVITYMDINEVKKWADTTLGKRGDDYLEFKAKKAEMLIEKLNERFPGIKNDIKNYYTSTPLTYRDYIACSDGSIYGISRDYKKWNNSVILPKTKIPNLLFTGQNINLHGVLGVTVGSILTASSILGMEYLMSKIKAKI